MATRALTAFSIVLSLSLSIALSVPAFAQLDPVRNLSGTTPATGTSPWIRSGDGAWTFFHGLDAHLIYLSQTGPEEQENDVFSTNWLGAGAQFALGDRAFVLARGRISLEPFTIEDSYPQFFQYIPEDALIDRMRPHDLFGEAAVQVGYRPTAGTLVSVYGALVGQPALGPAPAQLRASGIDFAEAPFAYEIQETMHDSTSVVTAGFATSMFTIEGSMFHDGATTGDHTDLDTGDIDSQSVRLTFTPSPAMALQVSRGKLGEGIAERQLTSASFTYGVQAAALTALWTRREYESVRAPQTAYGLEVALRPGRSTFMARAEWLDRPAGFPFPFPSDPIGTFEPQRETHYTAGYLFDLSPTSRYRLGVGVNIDYKTKTHHLENFYGHKPQGIYTFLRFRSAGT